jgi:hypothetical protein
VKITTFNTEMVFLFKHDSPSQNRLMNQPIFHVCEEASSGNRVVATYSGRMAG